MDAMISEQQEHLRKILEWSMANVLTMTHTADRLSSFVNYTRTTTQDTGSKDLYTQYIDGEVSFLDRKANPELWSLFALRSTFANGDIAMINRFNAILTRLQEWFMRSAYTNKETLPFSVQLGVKWKETIFQFLDRFTISETQFNIDAFSTAVDQLLLASSDKQMNIAEFAAKNPHLFPLPNAYAILYERGADISPDMAWSFPELQQEAELSDMLDKAYPKE